jgi:hypothetical protein
MGQYIDISFTGAVPVIPDGQVNIGGEGPKRPLHANLTDGAMDVLEDALAEAGISKSAFLEAMALHAPDLLAGDQRHNPIITTARKVNVLRVGRNGGRPRGSTRAAAS